MIDWQSFNFLLAQEADKPQQPGGLEVMLFPLVMIMVVWYIIILRPQQKDRKKKDNMLGSLKKNDSVVTIGGILGTVANVSQDGKEVTVKVDDNTRIKLLRSSIQGVITADDKK
jgi:preprotein translocase subunit YajC